MKLPELFSALVLMAFNTCVNADQIYRCGPAGAEFSQKACSSGERIEVSDSRTEEQRLQAVALAAKTEAWGTAMERDRLTAEAAYRPALAGSLNSSAKSARDTQPLSTPKLKRKRFKALQVRLPLLTDKRPDTRASASR